MSADQHLNRRTFERFVLQPMYTAVRVSCSTGESLEGHAYDVSEAGLRIELDRPVAAGTTVALDLDLPGEEQTVSAFATVVWTTVDEYEPGPARSALRITEFTTHGDRFRLLRHLASGCCRRAA